MKKNNDINDINEVSENAETEIVTEKPSSRFNWKNNRKLRLGTTATAFTAIVIAAVVIFNIIVGILYDRFPLSFDLTADNTYTMSEQGRAVAKNVEKDIEISVFLNETYFAAPSTTSDELNTVLRQFYLFSKEYNALSGGHITTSYYDLDADPTLATSFSEYDITYGSILFRCGEQHRLISVENLYAQEYDSYSYGYAYKSKVEEVLSSTVNSISGGRTVTVTFLTGHGESTDLISKMSSLYQLNGYATETLNFKSASASEIDETTEMLVIAAPTADYSLDEITRLREWLNNDGNLDRNLFVLCNFECKADPETNRHNLYDFLADDYGITVTDKLIVETDSNNYMPGPSGEFQPLTLMDSSDLTESTGVVFMPYTLQLKLKHDSDPATTGVGNVSLVEFSEEAELVDVESLGEGKTKVQKGTDDDVIGMAYAVEASGTVANHIIVSGSYLFPLFSTDYVEYKNEELMLEPVRNTCNLGNAIVISSKNLSTPTLAFTEANARAIQIFFVALPILLILISLIVFFRRRHL
ncbi:MAG: GldG family protein [Clostridia bacterium]|nr:GldG family protein [Clostridia bacterium]